jgi:hypothetical protein
MRHAWILSSLIVLACKSEPATLADLLGESSSWLATAAAVSSTTAANRAPQRYADDTLEESLTALASASSRLDDLTVAPALRADARRWIDAARGSLVRLRAELRAPSRDVGPEVRQLSVAADSLRALSDSARQLAQ